MDDRYVISGSDDTNIRFWKAQASAPIKLLSKREEDSRNYNKKLIDKYQYLPEIKRIKRHKQVPKYILNKKRELQVVKESKFKKLKNKEMNSKLGSLEYNAERTDRIMKSGIIKK